MKAVRIHQHGGSEVLQIDEIARPVPGPGQVLLRVAVAGLNYGDLGMRRGGFHHVQSSLPLTLGFEAAGVIEAVGPDVTTISPDERVVSLVDGGYAEFALAAVINVVPIPDGVSFAQALAIPVQGQTAYLALTNAARLQASERVLVHSAAGGVGSLAVQIAKLLGATTVVGTTTSQHKAPFITSLGADAVVSLQEYDWSAQVLRITENQGVNVVLETVGGEVGQQSLACLAPFGRMVIYGSLTGAPTPFVSHMLVPKCLSVIGYNTNVQSLADQRHASEELLRWIAEGRLQVTLEHTFPLDEVAAAHEALASNQTRGKVVLAVAEF